MTETTTRTDAPPCEKLDNELDHAYCCRDEFMAVCGADISDQEAGEGSPQNPCESCTQEVIAMYAAARRNESYICAGWRAKMLVDGAS